MEDGASYQELTSDFTIPEIEEEPIVGLELIVPGSSAPGRLSSIRAPIALLSSRVSCFTSGSNKTV
jgi:hypothetical protein